MNSVETSHMSLLSHLQELRKRLIWSVLSIFLGSLIVWIFFKPIFGFLENPYCDWAANNGGECTFLITDVLESFSVVISISGNGGLILAMPVILYQFARFVMPALYPKEKKIVVPFVFLGVLLFVGGAVGGYYLMPSAIEVLFSIGPDNFDENLKAQNYVSFYIKMIVAFGLAAELPLILVFLQKLGVLSTSTLRKNRRMAVVLILVLGAIITPAGDPFTLLAITIPMYIFFEISIIIGGRFAIQKQT